MRFFDQNLAVHSAGTNPAGHVHPKAVRVMKELGIDIGDHVPKNVNQFLDEPFDYVITVCDHAKESCPVFFGKVKHRLHIGFEDPAKAIGSDKEILSVFRKVRDDIKNRFYEFYTSIKNKD